MARAEIYTIEDTPAGRLSIMPRPRGGAWLAEEIGAIHAAGVDVLVSLLTAGEAAELDLTQEEGLCLAHGIRYLSLPIADFGLPDSHRETVGLLARLKCLLEEGKHVAIHCRQGIGRSSLIAASLLVTFGVPVDQAFARLAAARGRPVPDTEEQRAWVVAFAERRLW